MMIDDVESCKICESLDLLTNVDFSKIAKVWG